MQSIKSDLRNNYSIKKTYVLEKIYYDMLDMLDIGNDLYHFLSNTNPFLKDKRKGLFLYLIFKMEDFSSTLIKLIQWGIADAFCNCNRKKKWVQINIITAVPLSNPIEEYIIQRLKKRNTNRKYFIEKKVNNSIIGGFILRIEDKEWDSSLEENIRKLKIHLKNHICDCNLSTSLKFQRY